MNEEAVKEKIIRIVCRLEKTTYEFKEVSVNGGHKPAMEDLIHEKIELEKFLDNKKKTRR